MVVRGRGPAGRREFNCVEICKTKARNIGLLNIKREAREAEIEYNIANMSEVS